jgi:L-lactate dehydrogenase (cytochrome)/glycolate oxidase
LVVGSEQGLTLADNQAAFSELGFAPHVAGLFAKRDLSTTPKCQSISLPLAPTDVQAVHPDGEVAVACAAAARGTAVDLSSYASKLVQDVLQVKRTAACRCANPSFTRLHSLGIVE